jgi:hypothetical protein
VITDIPLSKMNRVPCEIVIDQFRRYLSFNNLLQLLRTSRELFEELRYSDLFHFRVKFHSILRHNIQYYEQLLSTEFNQFISYDYQ